MQAFIFMLLAYISSICFVQGQGNIISQNGKYGISDLRSGKIIVEPICDSIISNDEFKMFFILRMGDKFAYTYYYNIDSAGFFFDFKKTSGHWEIGEFVFEDLIIFPAWLEYYSYYKPNYGSGSFPYLVCAYKKNNKYGLIYIKGRTTVEQFAFGAHVNFSGLGPLKMTEERYDSIVSYSEDGVYTAISEGKYILFQILYPKYNDSKKDPINWAYIEYEGETFDSIPLCLRKSMYYSEREYGSVEYLRYVKKNDRWGLIKINPETKSILNLIPCINKTFKEIRSTYRNEVFYCLVKGEKDTIILADTKSNINYKFPCVLKEGWEATIYPVEFDTIPDKTTITQQNRYLIIALREINTEKTYKYKEIYIIDKNKNIKATYNDINAVYEYHSSPFGVLISKIIDAEREKIFKFLDLETGENIFSLRLSKNIVMGTYQIGTDYPNRKALIEKDGTYSSYYGEHCKLQMYLVIVAIEDDKKDKIIGYYDFLTKKFYKKKPPKINGRC